MPDPEIKVEDQNKTVLTEDKGAADKAAADKAAADKAAADKAVADKAAADKAAQAADYSKIKLPENSKLTTKDLEAAIAQAKKEGRPSDVVQLLINERDAAMKSYETSEAQRMKGESEKWLGELKADKEIGGDNFTKSVENAKRVVDKYMDKEFKEFLDKSGLGNHPMLVRAFSRIGKAFGEDHWKDGNPPQPQKEKDPAKILYDKT